MTYRLTITTTDAETTTTVKGYAALSAVLDRAWATPGFTLPAGRDWLTASELAAGFEVPAVTVSTVIRRHRAELESSGMRKISRAEANIHCECLGGNGYPRGLLVFPRRAVLNVAMLLRDSDAGE